MKTYIPKIADVQKNRKWFLIDLDGATLGRAAIEVANILRGKNKPIFTPHMDTGDNVVVINASRVKISGNKSSDKKYFRYTGYPGGLRIKSYGKMMEHDSDLVFQHAVKGMLPKNRLGSQLFRNLYVYEGTEHPHEAQKPKKVDTLFIPYFL